MLESENTQMSKVLRVTEDGLDGCPFCSADFSYDSYSSNGDEEGVTLHKVICRRCDRTWEGTFKLVEEE